MRSADVKPSGYRLTAQGRLVRTEPPRHATIRGRPLTAYPTHQLSTYRWRDAIYGSYIYVAIQEELERRRPATASLYYGSEKGWEPLYA